MSWNSTVYPKTWSATEKFYRIFLRSCIRKIMVIHESLCIIIFSYTRFHADKGSIVVSCRMEVCPQNTSGHVGQWVHSTKVYFCLILGFFRLVLSFLLCQSLLYNLFWFSLMWVQIVWYTHQLFNIKSPYFMIASALSLCLFFPSFKANEPCKVTVWEFFLSVAK